MLKWAEKILLLPEIRGRLPNEDVGILGIKEEVSE
jgi:hypothetical protein